MEAILSRLNLKAVAYQNKVCQPNSLHTIHFENRHTQKLSRGRPLNQLILDNILSDVFNVTIQR